MQQSRYNTGNVSSSNSSNSSFFYSRSGGIVGQGDVTVNNCYNVGTLSGNNITGIASSSTNNSYYLVTCGATDGGISKTEVYMKEAEFVSLLNSGVDANFAYKQDVMRIIIKISILWLEYFKLTDMESHLRRIDKWYRRRLRMCIWKCWKKIKPRFSNLIKCGTERKAWERANTRKGYWHISNSYILSRALCNDNLHRADYLFIMDCYRKIVS